MLKRILILFKALLTVIALFSGCDKAHPKESQTKQEETYKKDKEPKKDDKKGKETKKEGENTDKPELVYKSRPNDEDPNILWSYITQDSYVYYASPVLSSDESTIYFGTALALKSPQSEKDKVIALNRDGTLKWEYDTNKGEIRSNITVYNDNLYFAVERGRVQNAPDGSKPLSREKAEIIAIDKSGKELWRKQIAGSTQTESFGLFDVAVKYDKVVVVTDYLYVFDYLTGEELNKLPISPNAKKLSYIRPVINLDSAYFLYEGTLYEYNIKTSVLNRTDLSNMVQGKSGTNGIRFDSENNMYIGCGSLLLSFDKDKNHRWTYDIGNENINFRSSPAIDETNGLLYIGTKNNEDSQLLAINIDTGKLVWAYNPGGDVYSSPAFYNGLIYSCAEKGYLHILKTDGTLVQKILVNEEVTWPSPVIDKQGILYIAGMGDGKSKGFAYAIKTLEP